MKKSNKSRTLRAVSRLIGYIGVGACLIGALVYLILIDMGVIDHTLNLKDFYPIAGLAVVFIVIAVILRIASGVAHAKEEKAAENAVSETELPAEEPVAEEETAREASAEEEREEEIIVEENPAEELPAEEGCTEQKCKMEGKICEMADPDSKKCQICMAITNKKLSGANKAKAVAAVAAKTAPVAVAVIATATLAIVAGKRSSRKKIEKEKERVRRTILDLLY